MYYTVTKKRIFAALLFVLAAVLAVCGCLYETRSVQTAAHKRELPIYNIKTDEKKIAISFDAAWGNEETQQLIDILKEYNVKTTFFVVGAWVDKYPDSVRALAAAGHEVCNHSNTHPHMSKLSQAEMQSQITTCNEKIKAITGTAPILFRPPYGDYNDSLIRTVNGLKMYPVQWSVELLDTRIQIGLNPASMPFLQIICHDGAVNICNDNLLGSPAVRHFLK